MFIPLLKTLLNWLQVQGLLIDFDVPWPAFLEQLWAVSGSASTVPVSGSFLTCTMHLSHYARFWLAATAPVTAGVAALVLPVYFMAVAGRLDKATGRRSPHWGKWRTAVLVLAYALYSTVTREMVRMLDCSPVIGETSWLRADYRVECGTPTHKAHTVVAVLILVVFCLGLPVGTAVLLERRHRAGRLREASTQRRFLFLMDGFRDSRCWWEAVVQSRKLLLVVISATLGGGAQHNHQVYAGTLVIALALGLQVLGDPYVDTRQSRLETTSLVASVASLYAGLLFAIGGLSDESRVAVAFVVGAINLSFGGWCCFRIVRDLCTKVVAAQGAGGGEVMSRLRSQVSTRSWRSRATSRSAAGRRGGSSSTAGDEKKRTGTGVEMASRRSGLDDGEGAPAAGIVNPLWDARAHSR